MELTCTTRILNTLNPVEATPIPMVITEEDMAHASITELERQARLAWIYETLSEIDCDIDAVSGNHFRLYFTEAELRSLSNSHQLFIANCNRLPWLRVEMFCVPDEDEPKYYRHSLRNESEE